MNASVLTGFVITGLMASVILESNFLSTDAMPIPFVATRHHCVSLSMMRRGRLIN